VQAGEIVIIQRGIRFTVSLPDGTMRNSPSELTNAFFFMLALAT
jgi:homogentisate 1,2-dioxygenase